MKRKKNKKYKSNKIIILLSIVFAAILVTATAIAFFMFSQNTDNPSADNLQSNSQPSFSETTSLETTLSETALPETIPSETDSSEIAETSIYTSYKPYKAIESETAKETSLVTVFGSAYSQYGGELKLNEDKTFSLYVGISNSNDSEGTFVLEDDKINAIFNSGKEKEFTITEEDGITVIIVPMGLYNVYFKPIG